jgi:hypothetical protein
MNNTFGIEALNQVNKHKCIEIIVCDSLISSMLKKTKKQIAKLEYFFIQFLFSQISSAEVCQSV